MQSYTEKYVHNICRYLPSLIPISHHIVSILAVLVISIVMQLQPHTTPTTQWKEVRVSTNQAQDTCLNTHMQYYIALFQVPQMGATFCEAWSIRSYRTHPPRMAVLIFSWNCDTMVTAWVFPGRSCFFQIRKLNNLFTDARCALVVYLHRGKPNDTINTVNTHSCHS